MKIYPQNKFIFQNSFLKCIIYVTIMLHLGGGMVNLKYYLLENKRKILIIILSMLLCLSAACFLYFTKKSVTFLTESDKKQVTVYGFSTTKDALAKAGITLCPYDQISVALDQNLKDNDTIYINYNTADASNVNPAAAANENVSSQEIVNVASNVAVADVKTVANNPPAVNDSNVIQTSGGAISYLKEVQVVATAYCPCSICCAPYSGKSTADGSVPQALHTLATSPDYSFGTNIYIPYFDGASNHGIFEVEDRGGAIQGNKIDIFFNTHQEALQFGKKIITIYILN